MAGELVGPNKLNHIELYWIQNKQIKVKFVTIEKKKLVVASQFIVSYFLIPLDTSYEDLHYFLILLIPVRTPCIILSKLLVHGFFNKFQYIKVNVVCRFQVGDEFSRKPFAVAVQQGSPLKDSLNNA